MSNCSVVCEIYVLFIITLFFYFIFIYHMLPILVNKKMCTEWLIRERIVVSWRKTSKRRRQYAPLAYSLYVTSWVSKIAPVRHTIRLLCCARPIATRLAPVTRKLTTRQVAYNACSRRRQFEHRLFFVLNELHSARTAVFGTISTDRWVCLCS